MRNKLYSAVLAGSAVLVTSFGATSANAASATANATANIVQAITIAENTVLNFGTIVPSASAATVAVDTGSVRTCGGGLTCSGTAASGAFTATGTANQAVSISVGGATTLTGAGSPMALGSLTLSNATATLSGGGTTSFTVGGTLTVGASQAAGVYNGTYTVNVNYQ
jgi:hypothetical protein